MSIGCHVSIPVGGAVQPKWLTEALAALVKEPKRGDLNAGNHRVPSATVGEKTVGLMVR